ncbi:MAG: hypothetical protein H7256_15625 [Bdellovibrio sp.]|nr:hypothetical protein [Bdellovibrio sp.]
MKKNIGLLVAAASVFALSSCDKGGAAISVLASTSQFQQAAVFTPRKLDVLFVVDNSGSMAASQANLATNFPSFINYFKNKGYDYRLAVTTTDAYYGDQFVTNGCSLCTVGQTQFRSSVSPAIRVVDNNTPNLESVFSSNVRVGTTGSGDERAFSSMKAALNSSLNVDFHRADAFLAVIIVSDADDFSHDDMSLNESYAQATLHPVSNYVTVLNTFTHGSPVLDYSVSTIGVLDAACKAQLASGGENKIGNRYMQLSDLTGGTKNSICNSFATVLDNISTSIATQTQASFHLNRAPVVSSISVMVNGAVVPQSSTNGWSYDSVSQNITIVGSTYQPQAGAAVTINFDPVSLN